MSDTKDLVPVRNSLMGPLGAAAKNLVSQKRKQAQSLTRENREPSLLLGGVRAQGPAQALKSHHPRRLATTHGLSP